MEGGIYRENIVIDKGLNLRGSTVEYQEWDGHHSSTGTIFTVDNSDGFGAPPVANSSQAAITVSADNVNIENLLLANFTHGIYVEDSNDVDISSVVIARTQVSGISIASSDSVVISNFHMSGRAITNEGISILESSSSVELFGSIIIQCEKGINVAGDDVSIDGVELVSNTDDGIHITCLLYTSDAADE